MTRTFIFSLAIAAVTAATFAPVTAEAGGTQRLTLGQDGGHTTPGGLRGNTPRPRPAAGNSSPDNMPDSMMLECEGYGGGMITDEDGNWDCVDSAGNSVW